MRGEWIEIKDLGDMYDNMVSPLVRGEWIEIYSYSRMYSSIPVSPRERGVD